MVDPAQLARRHPHRLGSRFRRRGRARRARRAVGGSGRGLDDRLRHRERLDHLLVDQRRYDEHHDGGDREHGEDRGTRGHVAQQSRKDHEREQQPAGEEHRVHDDGTRAHHAGLHRVRVHDEHHEHPAEQDHLGDREQRERQVRATRRPRRFSHRELRARPARGRKKSSAVARWSSASTSAPYGRLAPANAVSFQNGSGCHVGRPVRRVQVGLGVGGVAGRRPEGAPGAGGLVADVDAEVEVLGPELGPRVGGPGDDAHLFEHRAREAVPVAEESRRLRVDGERGVGLDRRRRLVEIGRGAGLDADEPSGGVDRRDRRAVFATGAHHDQVGTLHARLLVRRRRTGSRTRRR